MSTLTERMQKEYTEGMEKMATSFGQIAGALNYSTEAYGKAMVQLKEQGCTYCNHAFCDKCENLSGWRWDSERHVQE